MSGPVDIMDHAVERSRDVLVTGMGFCLPGDQRPVFTAEDVWQIAAYGRSCLSRDGIYHGSVNLSDADFRERLPDFPGVFAQHFTDAHRFGLVSLVEAAVDAGLDPRAGDLTTAAILAGRASIDANVEGYQQILRADPE